MTTSADVPSDPVGSPGADASSTDAPVGAVAEASDGGVIALRGVRKAYGAQRVLNDLGLSVGEGEVFGFLGRNGAGKSTAIRILMGITRADAGQVRVFGQSPVADVIEVRRRIGYVAQEQNMYPWMTPRVLARFVRGFYPRWDAARWERLTSNFELPPKRRIGTFSGGMKAKLALSLALATRPDLLILDEPTAGMDPVARREFVDLVREHTRREGATTFFSTHLVDEIEAVADRIGIVEGGRTVYEGRLEPLRASLASFSAPLDADASGALPSELQLPADFPLESAGGRARVIEDRERRGRRFLTLRFAGRAPDPRALARESGWRHEPMTLEDVFVAVVAGRAASQGSASGTNRERDERSAEARPQTEWKA